MVEQRSNGNVSVSASSVRVNTTTRRSLDRTRSPASSSSRGLPSCTWMAVHLLLLSLGLLSGGLYILQHHIIPGIWIPPDEEIDWDAGTVRTRRRPDKLKKFDPQQNKEVPTTPFDGVMEAHLTLVSIRLPEVGLNPLITDEGEIKPYTVSATFCHISWELQNSNPSKYPMFKDLKKASFLCPGTTYTTDLYEIVQAAKSYDAKNHTFAATTKSPAQVTVAPSAVVFHETRCGSTLIANMLAGFSPSHSRVYSEAQPPIAALTACENDEDGIDINTGGVKNSRCEPDAHIQLIRDVFYMMGRVSRPQLPQYVFFKMQSIGVRHIDLFRKALPDTPWIWNYRDSVEILMSHFKQYYQQGKSSPKAVVPNCLRNYQKSRQPALVIDIVARANMTLSDLTREEYCAAHIASLAESAIRAQESTQHLKHQQTNVMTMKGAPSDATTTTAAHWFINYNELPHKLWESILPSLVVGHLEKSQISNMQQIAKYYAKSRGPDGPQLFHDDGTLKRGKAPESIKTAARKFLDPVYEKMESIRQQMDQNNRRKI